MTQKLFWARTKDPRPFTKKKDEFGQQSSTAWLEYSESSDTSGSDEKTRLEAFTSQTKA